LINAFGGTQKREQLRGCKKKHDVRVEPRIRIKRSKTRGSRQLKIKTTDPSATCPYKHNFLTMFQLLVIAIEGEEVGGGIFLYKGMGKISITAPRFYTIYMRVASYRHPVPYSSLKKALPVSHMLPFMYM
jgi:hypothetical protein